MTKNYGTFIFRIVIIFGIIIVSYGSTAYAAFILDEEQMETLVFLPVIFKQYNGGNDPSPGNSVVQGLVFNSRTNDPISSATVCLETTSLCDTTEADGRYVLQNVPVGGYTFNASVASSYEPASKDLIIQSNTTYDLDFGLLPWLDENEVRVVLTWDSTPTWPTDDGDKPNDLNLHMWIRTQGNERIDIDNLGDCLNLDAAFPYACYESDAQFGSGPDAIVVKNYETDTYTFAVLNYYAAEPGWPEITTLNARVRVYDTSGLIRDYLVPTTGEGDLWYVFDLDFGVPDSKNCIVYFDQSGDVPPECPTQ